MSNTNYKKYLEDIFSLAKSLVIKNETSSVIYNDYLIKIGQTVQDDPRTWRYYLNLSGQMHYLDKEMFIVSLDTNETIEFTKENLKFHGTTRTYYVPGTKYYNDLFDKYPDQEALIRGIINPVDIEKAIAAPDYSILSYDAQYVESNETNLIGLLEKRVQDFKERWNNPSYNVIDDLYLTAHLSILYYNIPLWILNIRLKNIKSIYVHSFHINEYLRSHGNIDEEVRFLSKEQSLFLYRNIRYIEKHPGSKDTFKWLVENIMTSRSLGMAEYDIVHDTTDLVVDIKPTVDVYRSPINVHHVTQRDEDHTLEEVLYKERYLTRSNEKVERSILLRDTSKIQNSKKAKLKTKILESSIIDWTVSGVVLKEDFLLNYWGYWASTGKYNTVVTINHPRTNVEFTFNIFDAFILFMYMINKSYGNTLTTIPTVRFNSIRKDTLPTRTELKELIRDDILTEDILAAFENERRKFPDMYSHELFNDTVTDIYNSFYRQREVYCLQERSMHRAQVQAIMDNLYLSTDVELGQVYDNSYSTWFELKGFDTTALIQTEYESLAMDILTIATGTGMSEDLSLARTQQAMLNIMKNLSSYSVQYLSEINAEPIVFWDRPMTRVTEMGEQANAHQGVRIISDNIIKGDTFYNLGIKYEVSKFLDMKYSTTGFIKTKLDLQPRFKSFEGSSSFLKINLPTANFKLL